MTQQNELDTNSQTLANHSLPFRIIEDDPTLAKDEVRVVFYNGKTTTTKGTIALVIKGYVDHDPLRPADLGMEDNEKAWVAVNNANNFLRRHEIESININPGRRGQAAYRLEPMRDPAKQENTPGEIVDMDTSSSSAMLQPPGKTSRRGGFHGHDLQLQDETKHRLGKTPLLEGFGPAFTTLSGRLEHLFRTGKQKVSFEELIALAGDREIPDYILEAFGGNDTIGRDQFIALCRSYKVKRTGETSENPTCSDDELADIKYKGEFLPTQLWAFNRILVGLATRPAHGNSRGNMLEEKFYVRMTGADLRPNAVYIETHRPTNLSWTDFETEAKGFIEKLKDMEVDLGQTPEPTDQMALVIPFLRKFYQNYPFDFLRKDSTDISPILEEMVKDFRLYAA